MLDTIVAPVLLNGERVAYAGSIERFRGQVFTIVDVVMDSTGAWRYFLRDEDGLGLDLARRASLVPLAW